MAEGLDRGKVTSDEERGRGCSGVGTQRMSNFRSRSAPESLSCLFSTISLGLSSNRCVAIRKCLDPRGSNERNRLVRRLELLIPSRSRICPVRCQLDAHSSCSRNPSRPTVFISPGGTRTPRSKTNPPPWHHQCDSGEKLWDQSLLSFPK